jgi:hypothetical protein
LLLEKDSVEYLAMDLVVHCCDRNRWLVYSIAERPGEKEAVHLYRLFSRVQPYPIDPWWYAQVSQNQAVV